MLDFKKVEIGDKSLIESFVKKHHTYFCDYCFVDIFIWRDLYQTMFCVKDDFLFIKILDPQTENYMYLPPAGLGDFYKALGIILLDCKEKNIPFFMTSLSDSQIRQLETKYPSKFLINQLRNSADYLYSSEDLIQLKGSKYHTKKNLVNRFKRVFKNRWLYEKIDAKNLKEVYSFYNSWYESRPDRNQSSLFAERKAVMYALDYYVDLKIQGGLLRVDNKVVAFSLGSQSNREMFVVQIEKADPSFTGAYQMINQQFVYSNCQGVRFINREEDLGILALRKSKMSYHPKIIAMKYSAKLNNGDEKIHANPLC